MLVIAEKSSALKKESLPTTNDFLAMTQIGNLVHRAEVRIVAIDKSYLGKESLLASAQS